MRRRSSIPSRPRRAARGLPGPRGSRHGRRAARGRPVAGRAAGPRNRRGGAPFPDPFAYDPDREDELTRRAAAGNSHILYARSPDGAAATAARVARYRAPVEEAAKRAGVDADLLEGARLPRERRASRTHMAGDTEGAAGLTQILAETGQNLLGMQIDVGASSRLDADRPAGSGTGSASSGCEAQRRVIDERFDPAEGAGRRRALPDLRPARSSAARTRLRRVPHGRRQPAVR